ncbi:MAG: phosphoribosylformylglycinamidine synthase subunit PurS [Elusimicrobia bacterium]|nr:phosphoribosylformylglycinamidine synthase subunit PurS [Elusimicrobiota bacterium]
MRKPKKEYCIEVCPKAGNFEEIKKDLKVMGLKNIISVKRSKIYILSGNLTHPEALKIAERLLCDSVSENFSFGNFVGQGVNITIFLKPSVLDIEGRTIREAAEIMNIRGLSAAHSGRKFVVKTKTPPPEMLCETIAERILFNPVIENARIVLNFGNGKR